TEMLELGMDMEADLGIDSIKRVEILGTVQDELPGLPELNPEDLAECRTLGEIVSYMQTKLPAANSVAVASTGSTSANAAAPAATGLTAENVQRTMLAVVADKTGYPTEMLELGMDMEADLGIDSIKRVEILGTVQDELPGLPELNPEDLAECRTLGEIVSYMQTKLPAASTVTAASTGSTSVTATAGSITAAPESTSLSAENVQRTMLSVVADKTGYPAEMLELSMDMEADLGIDSIKRVEILGTVQDELPGLPELNPEDLAECRTLGEIVSYMQTKLPAATTIAPVAPASTANKADVNTAALPPHSEVALKKLPAADKLADCFSTDSCIVITDDGHSAGLLAEKLNAKGLTVAVIRNPQTISVAHSPLSSDIKSYTLSSIDDAQIAQVIADIKADLGAEHAIAGFIHLQPQATANSSELMSCTVAAKAAVDNAFLWAKHLHAEFAKPTQASRLCYFTVSRLDGGFGYLDNTQLATAELNQAALSGLSKTLSHEWPQVFCRALDIANNIDTTSFADAIVAELFDINGANASADRINEVGISNQGRVTLVAGNASEQFAPASLNKNDTILVTGGAKGVTFECALTLAKQCQSHFVLAGRSQHFGKDLPAWAQGKKASELKAAAIAYIQSQGNKPTPKQIDALVWPISSSLEIDAALNAFSKVGASAQYVSMDVSNATAVAASLNSLTNAKGGSLTINGVIHGAGVLADKHIQDKTLDELNRVYHTKVTGLASIINALDPQQIKLIALFSSAAGFYGNTGQSDYAMSNEILNKTALKLAHTLPQAKVMSFNWGPWDGGMVSSALKKMFVERGVYVIPLQAGAELFAHSLLSQQGAQLLIGSDMQGSSEQDNAVKKLNADALLIAKGSLTFATNTLVTKAFTANAVTTEAVTIESSATDIISQTVTRVLTPAEMPFVSDHCIAGNPVLPTVCAMQWMRDAAETLCHVPVSIAEYKLLKGVIFDTNEPHLLQLELTQTDAGISALISSRLLSDPSAAMKPQYQAQLVINSTVLTDDIAKPVIDTASLTKWSHIVPLSSGVELYQNGTLFHGPRLQGIKQVLAFDDDQLLCQVQLPRINASDCQGFIPSSVLGGSQIFAEDLLLQAMLVWARLKYDAASLPASTGECVTAWPFANGDKGYIQLDVVKHSGRMLVANVSLYHQDGRLSCQMLNAKVTISKSLNGAFIPHQASAELSHKDTV
uniref:SDR family NAD(P)-dependent oxidoreductase n=1 Tax=Shewanella sp. S1-58-MNA-CIBAN-0166 TaxID=3140467 RepID=UPI0033296ABE